MSVEVQRLNDDVWDIISMKVKHAAVFIDNHSAECLHWNGGVVRLLNCGALSVKSLSPLESGSYEEDKAVFISCAPVVGERRATIETIVKCSNFSFCTVMTGAGKKVHSMTLAVMEDGSVGPLTEDPFSPIEDGLRLLMQQKIHEQDKVVEAEILFVPLFAINFGGEKNHILLTPHFVDLFPTLQVEASKTYKPVIPQHGKKIQTVLDDVSLPRSTCLSLAHLADSLHVLLSKFGGRTEVYSMGNFSNHIAGEISRRKAESWSSLGTHSGDASLDVSLVLVDRTLDLATPCSHGSCALLDRVMAALPHLPGHSTDIAVDMTPLSRPKKTDVKVVGYPSGCIAHVSVPGEKAGGQGELLDLLAGGRRQKEVILSLHRQIMSAAISCKVRSAAPKAERITPKVIETLIEEFGDHPDAVRSYCTLLQHGLCVSQALSNPVSQMFDYMSGAEKVLLQNLSLEDGKVPAGSDKVKEILSQVEMMISSRHDRGFTLNALLALLVHLFALPLAPVDYSSLRDALHVAFEEDFSDDGLGTSFTYGFRKMDASHVFKVLESVSKAREGLKKYRTLYSQEYSQRTVTHRPLLAQLVSDILNPSLPPVQDLLCTTSGVGHSAGIKGLLRSGLGHLMSVARPTPPGEAKVVIVFVVGGITGEEVRLVREALWSVKDKAALAAAPKTVVIGGTKMLTPDEVIKSLFGPEYS